MDWMARVRFPAGVRDFSLLHSIQTSSEAHPSYYPVGTRGSFPGVKWPGREADNLLPTNAKVKNGGAIPPLPTCLHGVVLNHLLPTNVKVKNGGAIPPLPHMSSWRGA
jgi:hypothetical protein